MRGWGWRSVHHPDNIDGVFEKLRAALETGQPWEDTFPLRGKDGEYRWFLSRSLPIRDKQGEIVRWFGTSTDITEQRAAESSLREKEEQVRLLNGTLEARVEARTSELAEVNRELEAFSYSVSHDLRAPLRSIDGFGQRLIDRYSGRVLDEVAIDYLKRMTRASHRMGELIEDLLGLARISRGDLDYRPVNLSALAERITGELRARDPHRNLRISIEPELRAYGDARLLHVALENLLENAWKYTSRKKHADIAFSSCVADGVQACFVRDNASRFDMKNTDHLFAPFQRLHGASEFEGNGIGLATVQRIVHRHGGRIWAEAEKGVGATFYFVLPHDGRRTGA